MIEIIPAIDLIDGKCVRLTKGDYASKKVYDGSVVDMAKSFEDCGVRRIHMVDLSGAKVSRPENLPVLEKVRMAVSLEIEWGGGIASQQNIESVFSAGADYVIVGSVAVLKPELFRQWLGLYGERMILGADVRGNAVAVKGWVETSGCTIDELLREFIPFGLKNVLCTDISRDGMLEGPSVELYRRLMADFSGLSFTASGGVSSMKDIEVLDAEGVGKVVVGKAIYESKISLEDIGRWSQRG